MPPEKSCTSPRHRQGGRVKILFLCGSLDPGLDGVGDYTRRLAAECVRQGNDCQTIAVNDRHLKSEQPSLEEQMDGDTNLHCARLPAQLPWRQRTTLASEWRQAYQPDMISLQFVPYSFHPKGLPLGLVSRLRQIGGDTPWHVMLHELWIGRRHSPLGFAVGPLQKRLCKSLLKKLPASIIHTHSTGYLERLREIGFHPQRLPLFGNIPVVPGAKIEHAPATLPDDAAVILHFGAISPGLEYLRSKLNELRLEVLSIHRSCHFVSIGSAGPYREDATGVAASVMGEDNVHFIGRVSAEQVSAWMQRAHIGLSRSPLHIYEKSGSTAAMLEHGMDVRLQSDGFPVDLDSHVPMFPPASTPSVEKTAELFLNSLKESPANSFACPTRTDPCRS